MQIEYVYLYEIDCIWNIYCASLYNISLSFRYIHDVAKLLKPREVIIFFFVFTLKRKKPNKREKYNSLFLMFIPVSLPLQEDLNEWKIKNKIFYTSVLTY